MTSPIKTKAMLSPEELMKPRFKVIIDYPHSPYKIGDVIDFGDGYSTKKMTETPYNDPWGEINYASNHYDEDEFRKYPALFQPLPWYAERSIDIMPAYLKEIYTGEVFQTKEYTATGMVYVIPNKKSDGDLRYTNLKHFVPSDETEYLTYKNKNNE